MAAAAPRIPSILVRTQEPLPQCPQHFTKVVRRMLGLGGRLPLEDDRIHAEIVYRAKSGALKKSYSVTETHEKLRQVVSQVPPASDRTNLAALAVSFLVQVDGAKEQVVFPFKPSGSMSSLVHDDVMAFYGGDAELLEARLGGLYARGRALFNPEDIDHGSKPIYVPGTKGHDQFKRHSEQTALAYLMSAEGVQMLLRRLVAETRGRFTGSTALKVYGFYLHIHSAKICCAPCEYSLAGFLNPDPADTRSFPALFAQQVAAYNAGLHRPIHAIGLPARRPLHLGCTYSADSKDSTHRVEPLYAPIVDAAPTTISVRSEAFRRIETAFYSTPFRADALARAGLLTEDLADYAIALSGSSPTAGTARAQRRIRTVVTQEGNRLASLFRQAMRLFSGAPDASGAGGSS